MHIGTFLPHTWLVPDAIIPSLWGGVKASTASALVAGRIASRTYPRSWPEPNASAHISRPHLLPFVIRNAKLLEEVMGASAQTSCLLPCGTHASGVAATATDRARRAKCARARAWERGCAEMAELAEVVDTTFDAMARPRIACSSPGALALTAAHGPALAVLVLLSLKSALGATATRIDLAILWSAARQQRLALGVVSPCWRTRVVSMERARGSAMYWEAHEL